MVELFTWDVDLAASFPSSQYRQWAGEMAGWTHNTTKAFISSWGEENIQEQLDSVKEVIYERNSAALADQGYVKS